MTRSQAHENTVRTDILEGRGSPDAYLVCIYATDIQQYRDVLRMLDAGRPGFEVLIVLLPSAVRSYNGRYLKPVVPCGKSADTFQPVQIDWTPGGSILDMDPLTGKVRQFYHTST